MSQTDLANQLYTSVSVISRYERDEMAQSIETAKKLAALLQISVGYLLEESEDDVLFKDYDMISRLKLVKEFSDNEKNQILFTIEDVINEVMNRRTYAGVTSPKKG